MQSMYLWPSFPPDLSKPSARSLSLLFVLQETLSSSEILSRLKTADYQDLPIFDVIRQLQREIAQIFVIATENQMTQKISSLDKLCFYCDILLKNTEMRIDEIPMLLEETRNSIFRFRSQLLTWEKSIPSISIIKESLVSFCDTAQDKLKSFLKKIVPTLLEVKTDENILMFLVEKKEFFNHLLGARSVEKILKSFFPNGIKELKNEIYQGYCKRGFSHIYSEKELLFDTLEWEEACRPLVHSH